MKSWTPLPWVGGVGVGDRGSGPRSERATPAPALTMLGPVQYRKKPLESTRKVTRFRLEASWGQDGTGSEGYGPGLVL